MGSITLIELESKSELKERLERSEYQNLIIGEDSEGPNNCTIFRIIINDGFKRIFEIGVISEIHGIEPKCIIISNRIFIGLNKEVHIFDSKDLLEHYKILLNSLFYEFIIPQQKRRIIVLHELGISNISFNGDIIWEHTTDIINEYKCSNGVIEIVCDQFIIEISEENGKILTRKKQCK